MAVQMNITLSDAEYAALQDEAQRSGKQPEILIHEAIASRIAATPPPMSSREFLKRQFQLGKLMNLPNPVPLTPSEIAEREQLARVFAQGQSASDMVIEDRGPKE